MTLISRFISLFSKVDNIAGHSSDLQEKSNSQLSDKSFVPRNAVKQGKILKRRRSPYAKRSVINHLNQYLKGISSVSNRPDSYDVLQFSTPKILSKKAQTITSGSRKASENRQIKIKRQIFKNKLTGNGRLHRKRYRLNPSSSANSSEVSDEEFIIRQNKLEEPNKTADSGAKKLSQTEIPMEVGDTDSFQRKSDVEHTGKTFFHLDSGSMVDSKDKDASVAKNKASLISNLEENDLIKDSNGNSSLSDNYVSELEDQEHKRPIVEVMDSQIKDGDIEYETKDTPSTGIHDNPEMEINIVKASIKKSKRNSCFFYNTFEAASEPEKEVEGAIAVHSNGGIRYNTNEVVKQQKNLSLAEIMAAKYRQNGFNFLGSYVPDTDIQAPETI